MRNELVLGLLGAGAYLAAGVAALAAGWRSREWWIAPFRCTPKDPQLPVVPRGWRGWQWDGREFDSIDWGAS